MLFPAQGFFFPLCSFDKAYVHIVHNCHINKLNVAVVAQGTKGINCPCFSDLQLPQDEVSSEHAFLCQINNVPCLTAGPQAMSLMERKLESVDPCLWKSTDPEPAREPV